MFKTIFASLIFLVSFTVNSCPIAAQTNTLEFCSSFKVAAICHCTSSGLPSAVCQDVRALYNRMLIVFGSLRSACQYQHHTDTQDCIDNWNCYLNGGIDSRGRSCNVTQQPCP